MAEGLVVYAHRVEHSFDLDATGVSRHEDHAVPGVTMRVGVSDPHEDEDLALRVPHTARPPLATVDDDLIALDSGGGRHVGRVGGSDSRLCHGEGAADASVKERLEPLRALVLV